MKSIPQPIQTTSSDTLAALGERAVRVIIPEMVSRNESLLHHLVHYGH
jgi:hypothetical protein